MNFIENGPSAFEFINNEIRKQTSINIHVPYMYIFRQISYYRQNIISTGRIKRYCPDKIEIIYC